MLCICCYKRFIGSNYDGDRPTAITKSVIVALICFERKLNRRTKGPQSVGILASKVVAWHQDQVMIKGNNSDGKKLVISKR